jgi:hypothetical protein
MIRRASILLVTGWLLAACSPPSPDIDVATAHDMGSIVKGEVAVADLTVRNLGNAPLTVQAVSTSCGCTKAFVTPMTIPPGGEARLHVEYDSGVHESDRGLINRSVYISSDDPDEDDVRIQFTVIVEDKPRQLGGRPNGTHAGPV